MTAEMVFRSVRYNQMVPLEPDNKLPQYLTFFTDKEYRLLTDDVEDGKEVHFGTFTIEIENNQTEGLSQSYHGQKHWAIDAPSGAIHVLLLATRHDSPGVAAGAGARPSRRRLRRRPSRHWPTIRLCGAPVPNGSIDVRRARLIEFLGLPPSRSCIFA